MCVVNIFIIVTLYEQMNSAVLLEYYPVIFECTDVFLVDSYV